MPRTSAKQKPSAATFKPRRGRPTAAQSAAIESAILNAAKRLMLANGFNGTSMETVAKTAGVPKSTLYNRFPDKFQLLDAVVSLCIADWASRAERHTVEPTNTLKTRLQQRAENFMDWAVSDDVRATLRLIDDVRSDKNAENITNTLKRFYKAGYSQIRAAIEEDITTIGGETPSTAANITEAFLAMLTGWHLSKPASNLKTQDEISRFINLSIDLLLQGRGDR